MVEPGFEPGPLLDDSGLKGSTRISPQMVVWGREPVGGLWVTLIRVTLHFLAYLYLTPTVSMLGKGKQENAM